MNRVKCSVASAAGTGLSAGPEASDAAQHLRRGRGAPQQEDAGREDGRKAGFGQADGVFECIQGLGRSRNAPAQAAIGSSGRSGSTAPREAAASTCPGCDNGISLLTTTRLTTNPCWLATSARYPSRCGLPVPNPPAIPMPGRAWLTSAQADPSAASKEQARQMFRVVDDLPQHSYMSITAAGE